MRAHAPRWRARPRIVRRAPDAFATAHRRRAAIRRPDDRICIGGARALEHDDARFNTDDSTLSGAVGEALRRKLRSLTGLDEIPVEGEWTGVLGFTKDGNALIGKVPGREHVYVCGGFCGHGMPQCFGGGKAIASMICGRGDEVHVHVKTAANPARFSLGEK